MHWYQGGLLFGLLACNGEKGESDPDRNAGTGASTTTETTPPTTMPTTTPTETTPSTTTSVSLPADVSVSVASIDLGSGTQYETLQHVLVISNAGDEDLRVDEVELTDGTSVFELSRWVAAVLEPGESEEVTVSYTPAYQGLQQGMIRVSSDDPDEPTVDIPISGTGLMPLARIEHDETPFYGGSYWCDEVIEVEIFNDGDADLTITNIIVDDALRITGPDFADPIVVPPLGSAVWPVTFAPGNELVETAIFEVISDDLGSPTVTYISGQGAPEAPETISSIMPTHINLDVLVTVTQLQQMEDQLAELELGMETLVDALDQLGNWQLIVVTEDDGCSSTPILTTGTPGLGDILNSNLFTDETVDPILTSSLIQLSERAAAQSGPGQCNEGFLRSDATLQLLAFTTIWDSDPWSQNWIQLISGHMVDANAPVHFSGVIDLQPQSDCGWGLGGSTYASEADSTGGSVLDVCIPGWGSEVGSLLDGVQPILPPLLSLADSPYVDIVEVTIDGVPSTLHSWDYSVPGVIIDPDLMPPGSEVAVTYIPPSPCPPVAPPGL